MALAYALLYAGLRTTTGSAATVATLLEPVSAALLSVLLSDERLTWQAWLGGVLILAAVAALRPTETPPAPACRHRPDPAPTRRDDVPGTVCVTLVR